MYIDIFNHTQPTLLGMFIKYLLSGNKFRFQV